jgi:predicted nucleic acid-binding protein
MNYLVDTNILLRLMDRMHAQHAVVRTAVRKLRMRGDHLHVTTQNFVEFWNVATRPATRNGFGLMPHDAEQRLRILERLFPLLPDSPGIYPEWRRLTVTFDVRGVQVHDARLVAAMKVLNMTHILTFNTVDFRRYAVEGIITVDQARV